MQDRLSRRQAPILNVTAEKLRREEREGYQKIHGRIEERRPCERKNLRSRDDPVNWTTLKNPQDV